MECYLVTIPIGTRIVGTTAGGEKSSVFPGEYLVQRLTKAPAFVRLVGADSCGRDIHVSFDQLQYLTARGVKVVPFDEHQLRQAA